MKKLVTVIIILMLISIFCFSACANDKEYALLNEISRRQYGEVTLDVTQKGEFELNSKFTVKRGNETVVTYSYQQLASFDKTDVAYDFSSMFIETKQGEATVQNGKVVSFVGDEIPDASLSQLSDKSFSFDRSFFTEAKFEEDTFSASVTNPKAFMKNDSFEASDMRVTVKYERNDGQQTDESGSLKSVCVTYVDASGAAVTLNYSFAE